MNGVPFLALVDTNDLGEGIREAIRDLVPFLIVLVVGVIIGAVVLIRLGGGLVRRAASTSRGRRFLQAIVVGVFAVGGLLYLGTAVSYDFKSIAIIGLIATISLPSLAVVIRLLDEPDDDIGYQLDAEDGGDPIDL